VLETAEGSSFGYLRIIITQWSEIVSLYRWWRKFFVEDVVWWLLLQRFCEAISDRV